MQIFGLEITRSKAKMLSAVPSGGGGWFGIIRESFSGAFQQNVAIDGPRDILSFSGVFAPLTLIASDIAKLRIKLVEEDADGICTEIKTGSPWLPVLRKPNRYQTRIMFIALWILSKLLRGNTYALKQRDRRGIVVAMYVLDAGRVTPLVAEDGGVYYQLTRDDLSELKEGVTIPASEIIHDRMNCLWHPLVGISPLYACGISATMGNRIQRNSTKFFDNMSRPSGQLTAPGTISTETAARLKSEFEQNFSGANIGRLLVAGDGLKYEAMTVPAQLAQLIEQLDWTKFDCADCFHMPHFMIGGPVTVGSTVGALLQLYYSGCLQSLIEEAEACLDEGLGLPAGYYTEFDLDNLLRMDQSAQMTMLSDGVKGVILAPNEARAKLNMKPVDGGDAVYSQQQNFNLSALAKRDALADPFAKVTPPAPVAEPKDAANDDKAAQQAAALMDRIIKGLACDTSN
ncbi:MAG: phage portal protein [Burkholderiales bacterium]